MKERVKRLRNILWLLILMALIFFGEAMDTTQAVAMPNNDVHYDDRASLPETMDGKGTIRLADFVDEPSLPSPKAAAVSYGPPNASHKQRRAKDKVGIETCNGTCWTAIKERLMYTQADVLIAQEHKSREEDIDDL